MSQKNPPQVVELASRNLTVKLLNIGASLVELKHRSQPFLNLVLRHEELEEYSVNKPYFGCVVGRVANRIAGSEFHWKGSRHKLEPNEGSNHLHGGPNSIATRTWDIVHQDESSCVFGTCSPDGENGYPGEIDITATYLLSHDTLCLIIKGFGERSLPFDPTAHSYFNLDGSPNLDSHTLLMEADCWLPVNSQLIPTGEILPIAQSPLGDSNNGKPLSGLETDHYYISSMQGNTTASLSSKTSGLQLRVHSRTDGVQIYTANYLGEIAGFTRNQGICIEPHGYPNWINNPSFPQVLGWSGWEEMDTVHFERRIEYRVTTLV